MRPLKINAQFFNHNVEKNRKPENKCLHAQPSPERVSIGRRLGGRYIPLKTKPDILFMDSKERKRIKERLKAKNKNYISEISSQLNSNSNLESRLSSLRYDIVSLLRKEEASESGYKLIKKTSSLFFGIVEDIKRLKLKELDFTKEKEVINSFLINYLEKQIRTNYNGKVASFGESLLCGYLDCFFNASKSEVDKHYGLNPSFLINPTTNQLLEIDVALKTYRVYFEFQGHPSHYNDTNTILKDAEKLRLCFANNKILIPINIVQLNKNHLIETITNTLKDNLDIKDVISGNIENPNQYSHISNKQMLQFSRLIQKVYLSTMIFDKTLVHLDNRASVYINNMKNRDPNGHSQNYSAPRHIHRNDDFNIETLYYGLMYLSRLRSEIKKSGI